MYVRGMGENIRDGDLLTASSVLVADSIVKVKVRPAEAGDEKVNLINFVRQIRDTSSLKWLASIGLVTEVLSIEKTQV